MPQLAKLNGVELAAHLNARAFDQAFPRPNERCLYFMIVGPASAWLLALATQAAMPAGWWNPGSLSFALLWSVLFWRFVILPKQRRALRDILHECGHCPACGYDLRASPERCPECGASTGKSAENSQV
jgi:hypothetical protein